MEKSLQLPSGYHELLQELKGRIRTAQVRPPLPSTGSSSSSIGRSAGTSASGLRPRSGAARLSTGSLSDLQTEFPGVEGLQPSEPPLHAFSGRGLAGARRFCNSSLQNCPGATMSGSWTGSRTVPRESGTFAPRSNTAGVGMSWSFRSRAVCTRGKGRPSPTSSVRCRP